VGQKYKFRDWILFEDDHYVVINKPSGIATLEDRASRYSVLAMAKSYHSDCQVCHRLDKDTSGVLVIAKSNEAYRHANMQFSDRQVAKTYHAMVDGVHSFTDRHIDLSIHVSASGAARIRREGKPSMTIVNTLETFKKHSLIEAKPITGRMHQIRVHLAAIGAPLIADTIYGGKDLFLSSLKRNYKPKSELDERPIMPRVALHAFAITFKNLANKNLQIEAPYPKDFNTVLNQLRKAN
jgi:23S rRNA pseudouridine955/2504/2580 synthase